MKPAKKTCVHCGRTMSWRKKWANEWDTVKYCSDRCRRSAGKSVHQEIERVILSMVGERRQGSICPSEAARAVDPEGWRDRMSDVRDAARRLAAAGRIVITQGGRAVDPAGIRGPVRLALRRS